MDRGRGGRLNSEKRNKKEKAEKSFWYYFLRGYSRLTIQDYIHCLKVSTMTGLGISLILLPLFTYQNDNYLLALLMWSMIFIPLSFLAFSLHVRTIITWEILKQHSNDSIIHVEKEN